jgi:ATP-binding cassette subfamily B protein
VRVSRLRERQEWKFFGALYRSAPVLAVAWWVILVVRGLMPVLFALAIGLLVGAVNDGDSLTGPLGWPTSSGRS